MRSGVHRPSGFALVELLVIVLFVAIVAAIAVFALSMAFDKAKQRATMADMRDVASAVESYIEDNQAPPPARSIDDLVEILTPRYASALPTQDHWNHPLNYISDGVSGYVLESPGKDGISGEDITLSRRFDFELDIVLADGQFIASPE